MRTRVEMQLAASVGTGIGVGATVVAVILGTALVHTPLPVWVGLPTALAIGGWLGYVAPELAKRYARWRADLMQQEQEARDDQPM